MVIAAVVVVMMVVGRPVTIARRQSKNPFYRITRGRVADCMPAENHEKKKGKGGRGGGDGKRKKGEGEGEKKKGRIDRPRRVHYALLYARALYAILFVVSRRLGELLFFSLLPSLPPSPRSISLRHGSALCVISIPMTEEKWKATG